MASISKQYLDLVPLRLNDDEWSFVPSDTIRLSGAHGEEIVRSIHVSYEVSNLRGCTCARLINLPGQDGTIFTAGEDGIVRAWRTSMGEEGEEKESAETQGQQKKKKKKKKGNTVTDDGIESGRFKPY